jgi:hypothetical protein
MKIAICVPARDTVHAGFARSLANLTASLAVAKIDFELLINLGSVIAQQRNILAEQALSINATHILWLDSDMHVPTTTVARLLAHKKPIVAGTYSTRVKPQRSVAFVDQYNLNQRLEHTSGIHQVFAVGMGCMLVDAEVYRTLDKPWFHYHWNEDTEDLSGEDIYFCKQALDNGYEIFVDCDLSQELAHFGSKAYLIQETS